MFDLILSLYGWRWGCAAAAVGLGACALFSFVLFPSASRKSGAGNSVRDLQKAGTVKRFTQVLLSWSDVRRDEGGEPLRDESGNPVPGRDDAVRVMKRENIVNLDFIFPFVYGLTFAFAYACARGEGAPTPADLVWFCVPLAAGALDLVENTLHLYLLRGIDTAAQVRAANFSPALVFAAYAFATVKYALITGSFVSIVVVLLARLSPRG